MSIKDIVKNIDPKKEYNLSTIRDKKLFPGIKRIETIRKIVQKDMFGENMLKTKMSGFSFSMKYSIRGKNIIKFLNKYGAGMEL